MYLLMCYIEQSPSFFSANYLHFNLFFFAYIPDANHTSKSSSVKKKKLANAAASASASTATLLLSTPANATTPASTSTLPIPDVSPSGSSDSLMRGDKQFPTVGTPPVSSSVTAMETTEDDSDSGSTDARRKKKARTTFTGRQIFELEKQFEIKKYLSSSERTEMAKLLNVTETQVSGVKGKRKSHH